jgi:uncharacterized HAD superfamily protein
MTDREKKTIAVDIDDTLADTAKHFARLLTEKYGNPEMLTPEETILKYNIIPAISYWQTPDIVQWLHEQSHSNEAQELIPLTKDAITSLQKLAEHYDILYISARTESVREGTEKWLAKHGFPKGELVLRTTYDKLNGNAWKAALLEQKWPTCIGIIDDNPEIIHAISRHYKGAIYLYGKAQPPESCEVNVIPCKDWNDVIRLILKAQ